MNILFASVIAILFGAGAFLMTKNDLIRFVIGLSLISNSILLFLMSVSLFPGAAPIYPIQPGETPTDPVAQALTLTAVVINFGFTALLLTLIFRIYTTHKTIDQEEIRQIEEIELWDSESSQGRS